MQSHRSLGVPEPSPDRAAVKLRGALALVALILAAVLHLTAAETVDERVWTFAGLAELPRSYGFETHNASAGAWRIEDHSEATDKRALVNHRGEEDRAPALAILRDFRAADAKVRTRCRGSCGVVFRVLDARTHYVARIDDSARVAVLAVVADGEERELARRDVDHRDGWRSLEARVAGDRIEVGVDGATVIAVRDGTIAAPGAKGLWAPALGSATFDVFAIAEARGPGQRVAL
jgi:hypothetical protein